MKHMTKSAKTNCILVTLKADFDISLFPNFILYK